MGRVLRLLDSVSAYVPWAGKPAKRAALRLIRLKTKLKRLPYTIRLKRARKMFLARPPRYRALVVMNLGIGNAVEATPLVQAIRMLWPRAEVTIFPPPGDLFEDWCAVDHIAHCLDELQGQHFTHTFFSWLTGHRWECNCDLGQTYYAPLRRTKWPAKPEREYNLDMVRRLGYKGPTPPLYVSLREPKAAIRPPSNLRLCIVPGGKPENLWRHKRWPYYDQLIRSVLSDYADAQVIILGGHEDEFPGSLPIDSQVVDLRGRLTLRETAWVLRSADLAIGNDCGPMHIADAVQTRAVVIFGPSCEVKNRPLHSGFVVFHDTSCRPCQYDGGMNTCSDPKCMTELTPKKVLDTIKILLKYS